jgi:outer membrane protein assembly factor BamB
MLALLLMSVNASACAPRVVHAPASDPTGWSEPLGSGARAPSANESLPPQPDRWWRARLGRAVAGPPALGEQVIAVLGLDRDLTLVEWETGDRIWRKRLSAPGAGGPLLAGDRVYAATAGRSALVYAYRLADGKRLWKQGVGPVVGPIATAGGLVIVGTELGDVVALAPDKGEPRWTRRLDGPVRSGVTAIGADVLVATDDSVFLLSATDGATQASIAAPGTVVAPPAWVGETVVLASPDGFLVGLRRTGLDLLWSVRTGEAIFGGPAIARDTVFAVTVGGWLWRVPLGNPYAQTRDSLGAAVRATPAPVANGVLVGTLAGEILLVRRDTVERRARVAGPIEQPPIVRDGVLLVIGGKGTMEAWR